ncbi:MAG: sensor histidine kinase, partial [Archangium sp.]
SLAVDNARLFQQAQQAIRVREDFLAIASHELRTPLTPLQLQLQQLVRRAPQLALDEQAAAWMKQRFRLIQHQLQRLARLIDDLLDISRLVGGRLRLDLEPVSLPAVVRDVLERLREEGEVARHGSDIRLHLAEGPPGRWDRLRLDQAVSNLLSNALKYGAGQPIELSVRHDARHATLVVEDHGIGIPPEDQERIFGRFERAVSVRHFGGFGLGLYITRQVVEALGGTIHLESQPGQGATFIVTLPLAGPPASYAGALHLEPAHP